LEDDIVGHVEEGRVARDVQGVVWDWSGYRHMEGVSKVFIKTAF
jgi:hypothetical protein